MDQIGSYCILSCILLFSTLLILLKTKITSNRKYRLPPGPWALPLIGSIHHLIGSPLHHAIRDLSLKHGEIMFLHLGEHRVIVISSRNAASEIFKTHDVAFATRPINPTVRILTYGGKDIAYAPYGEYWRQMRKICILELLSSKRVQSFRSIREKEVRKLITNISSLSSEGNLVNVTEGLTSMINDITVQACIGNKCKDQQLLLDAIEKGFELGGGFNLADLFPSSRFFRLISGAIREAKGVNRCIDWLFDEILEAHRGRKENEVEGEVEDLLGVLLRVHQEDPQNSSLTMDSIKAVITDAFAAGSETSSTTLVWALAELMRNPRVMKKAQSEIRQQFNGPVNIVESDFVELNYLHLVIKETLRLHPPFPLLLPRENEEACEVLGYHIPKGTTLVVNAWAIGRNSEYWKNAEEFKPERFEDCNSNIHFKGTDFEFIPFGSGRRICPGISFGLANIELALTSLLYHFDWKLPCGTKPDELDMKETLGLSAKRRSPLMLHAQRYLSP